MQDYILVSALEIFVGLLLVVCPVLILTRLPQWLGKPGVIRAIFLIVGVITGIGGIVACWNTLQQEGVLVLFRGSIELLLMGLFLIVCPKEMLEDYARRWSQGSRSWSKGYVGPVLAMTIGFLLLMVGYITYSNGPSSFH